MKKSFIKNKNFYSLNFQKLKKSENKLEFSSKRDFMLLI